MEIEIIVKGILTHRGKEYIYETATAVQHGVTDFKLGSSDEDVIFTSDHTEIIYGIGIENYLIELLDARD